MTIKDKCRSCQHLYGLGWLRRFEPLFHMAPKATTEGRVEKAAGKKTKKQKVRIDLICLLCEVVFGKYFCGALPAPELHRGCHVDVTPPCQDPRAPKGAMGAFMHFSADKRKGLNAENPRRIPPGDMNQELSRLWRDMGKPN